MATKNNLVVNRTQFRMTCVTSAKKAFDIAKVLKSESRFINVIRYNNKGTIEYYIFYYNWKTGGTQL